MIVDKNAKSLEESVYYKLEEEILGGELRAGDILTETALSQRLGVSRTPLRAAMHRLAEEGLIEQTPNKGAVVLGVSTEDLLNIYRIRIRLEGLASSLAALNITDDQLSELREGVELAEFYVERRDTEHLKELDTEFHRLIYSATKNRQLERILSDLHRTIRSYRKLSISVPERLLQSVSEHREILRAIENRDSALAEKLTEAHVGAALENLLLVVGRLDGKEK